MLVCFSWYFSTNVYYKYFYVSFVITYWYFWDVSVVIFKIQLQSRKCIFSMLCNKKPPQRRNFLFTTNTTDEFIVPFQNKMNIYAFLHFWKRKTRITEILVGVHGKHFSISVSIDFNTISKCLEYLSLIRLEVYSFIAKIVPLSL